MTKEQPNLIIIVVALMVLAVFVLPKIGLFAITQPPIDAIFPIEDSWVYEGDTNDNHGFENSLLFGYAGGDDCDDEEITYMKFELDKDSEMYRAVKAGNDLIKTDLYVYVERADRIDIRIRNTTNDWSEGTITWDNKPRCHGTILTHMNFQPSDDDGYVNFEGLADFVGEKIRANENIFSICIEDVSNDCDEKVSVRSKDYIFRKRPFLDIDYPSLECTENEIMEDGGKYYICRDQAYIEVVNFITLSEEEQQRLMDLINQLELTIEQKAQIISDLTTTLEGQLVMIEQLEILTEEKAQIIIQLNLNLEEQSLLISQMQLTVAEQYVIINELDLTIQQQADLINQMQVNLVIKAELIQLLQVENENQAQLIAEMELSFAEQASIINALQNVIGDDAEIILNLYDTVEEQAQLINQLELTKDELAQLVTAMGLTISENADLINQLELTTEEQLEIIASLELSLEQERELISQLRLTIEEQNKLIEELKVRPPDELDLEELWENYKIWIIMGGALILLLILTGGKKR